MTHAESPLRRRNLKAITAALAMIGILLIVQIWLLIATVETYLAGHHGSAIPGAILSGILFTCCCALLRLVNNLDRKSREQ